MRNKNDYESLRDEWYEKLRKSGFEDIEDSNGHLKKTSFRPTAKNIYDQEAIASYYSTATDFLYSFPLPKKIKKIWQMHVEGHSLSEIACQTNSNKTKIFRLIRKYQRLAGLKTRS